MMKVKTQITELFNKENPFEFFSGAKLYPVQAAYQTYGKLNENGDNTVLICHALTGNSHAAGYLENVEYDKNSNPDLVYAYSRMNLNKPGWWDPLIGPGKVFDTEKYFVICSNILGSCYGTTGPVSLTGNSEKTYQADFPSVTIRDMVVLQKHLLDYLGVKKIRIAAGGSLGGMQVFEWALTYPHFVESIIPIATAVRHSPWAIGLNQIARDTIKTDPQWNEGFYTRQPENGLSIARKAAMISYRSFSSFMEKFNREKKSTDINGLMQFEIESYLDYQGKKLAKRFDANSYITITNAMDDFDIGFDRGNLADVLGSITQPVLSVGISSDILYPPVEQKSFVNSLVNAVYREINSIHGHDGFLIEFDQLIAFIHEFISNNKL